MTFPELQIQFDLNPGNRVDVLRNVDTCSKISIGYLFVDQEDGQCYLFDKNGHKDDISKVKKIETSTFSNCTSLTSISIPNSVKSIESWAFVNCTSLTTIKIPDLVESIGDYAFGGCASLTSIKIPNSVEWIGAFAFVYCNFLKELVFKGKTMKQVKAMEYYPWEITDKSVIKTK